jgi:2-beta-glucuronyltransferase
MMHNAPTVTFITGHYYPSPRRAGFHNLADAAHRAGYRVNFITVGYSALSYLRGDYRTRLPDIRKNCNTPVEIKRNCFSYVYFTPWHPHTLFLPVLNRCTMSFMDRYGKDIPASMLALLRETDIFVFESMCGLFLFKRIRRENPAAKTIYRVSDDIRVLRSTHPRLLELEREIAPLFDLVSVPASVMLDKFPGLPSLRLHRHGLDKAAYDACAASPYQPGSRNAVFVGTGYLDAAFVRRAAAGNRHCDLHIIGPFVDVLRMDNVRFHGEMPCAATVPYVKFADVGLMNLLYRNDASASFTDSLKVVQYRYCGLPIAAPEFLNLRRDGVFYYRPGDAESCATALREALASGRDAERAREVRSLDEMFAEMFGALHRSAA